MNDQRYNADTIPTGHKVIFEQLLAQFPDCELWVRSQNYGRWFSAALVHPVTRVAATIPLIRGGSARRTLLHDFEMQQIRERLADPAADDLELPPPN